MEGKSLNHGLQRVTCDAVSDISGTRLTFLSLFLLNIEPLGLVKPSAAHSCNTVNTTTINPFPVTFNVTAAPDAARRCSAQQRKTLPRWAVRRACAFVTPTRDAYGFSCILQEWQMVAEGFHKNRMTYFEPELVTYVADDTWLTLLAEVRLESKLWNMTSLGT